MAALDVLGHVRHPVKSNRGAKSTSAHVVLLFVLLAVWPFELKLVFSA